MTQSQATRACVIGAGIIGSWTALHLAESGVDTVLLEQFPLPHTRGSSHGATRAFRFLGDPTLDRLEYSLERWLALEADGGETLHRRTGLLNFGPVDDPWLAEHMDIVRSAGRRCEWLDAGDIRARFPQLRYPESWGAAWDPEGAILFAHRCLAAVQARFQRLGGRMLHARASAVNRRDPGLEIALESDDPGLSGTLACDNAVVCCGPWTGRLLPQLAPHLNTLAIPVTYWHDPGGEYAADNGLPILYNARLKGIYALPGCEYPGLVKVLCHDGPQADPEQRDRPDRSPWIGKAAAYVAEHLPGLQSDGPALEETCMYTMTPDGEPVIDRLGDQLVVGCGFSGSGFKHSPATGRMLAALALRREAQLPRGFQRERYRLGRFA